MFTENKRKVFQFIGGVRATPREIRQSPAVAKARDSLDFVFVLEANYPNPFNLKPPAVIKIIMVVR